MSKDEAIEIALTAMRNQGVKCEIGPHDAIWKNNDMRLGYDRCGWLVFVKLDLAIDCDPSDQMVEIYDPDGYVHIPRMI